jgi:hypothetical protein
MRRLAAGVTGLANHRLVKIDIEHHTAEIERSASAGESRGEIIAVQIPRRRLRSARS